MDLSNLSSNWKKLKATLPSKHVINKPSQGTKRKAETKDLVATKLSKKPRTSNSTSMAKPQPNEAETINQGLSPNISIGKYISVDCEMVGIGPMGTNSALARVSIVNYNGEQVYDSYVRPKEMVMDWRTPYSGITAKHMVHARDFETVQKEVAEIFQGRVLVGHSLSNDLDVLFLSHPKYDLRDTARHKPYRELAGGGWPKLKILASELLGIDIQKATEGHSSLEDARACMMLFKRDKEAFEGDLPKHPAQTKPLPETSKEQVQRRKKGGKRRKKKTM